MEYFPNYHQNNIEKTILQTFLKLKKKKILNLFILIYHKIA